MELDSEKIPSNVVLIAKLNDQSADNERELYSILTNEKEFRALKKVGNYFIYWDTFSFKFTL